MSVTRRDFAIAATAAVTVAMVPVSAFAAVTETAPLPERLADALVELFGKHPGFREIHAKGVVCEGVFQPGPQAQSVSRAPHFARATPATIRFSDFAGIPTIPSADPNASPHGLGIKFHTGAKDTDLVGHSVDAFPAATGEAFLNFIKALSASPPDAAHPTAIERYLAANPAAMNFVKSMPPPPQSYAASAYFMINAFKFINASNQTCFGRYRVLPRGGVVALDPSLIASRSPDYLAEELTERLKTRPAVFDIELQIADPHDRTDDGTISWPADRRRVALGTLTVNRIVADSPAAQRSLLFDPTHLIDGIELSDDQLPAVRSATYAISFARRSRG